MNKKENKVTLREMFEEYARKEIEFVKESDQTNSTIGYFQT